MMFRARCAEASASERVFSRLRVRREVASKVVAAAMTAKVMPIAIVSSSKENPASVFLHVLLFSTSIFLIPKKLIGPAALRHQRNRTADTRCPAGDNAVGPDGDGDGLECR